MSHEPLLRIVSLTCWMLVAASQGTIVFRNFLGRQKQQNTENIQVGTAVLAPGSCQKASSGMIITFTILSIPLVVLILIIVWNEVKYHPEYIVSDPSIRAWGDIGWLLIAVGYLANSIDQIFNSENKLFERILKLLYRFLGITGFAICMFYLAHVTVIIQ